MQTMTNEIPIELTLLIWAAALTILQMLVSALGSTSQIGLTTLAGNRDNLPETTGWASRAQRAHRNMLESITVFAILVLSANVMSISNDMTILGAQLFFWGRVAFSIIYLAGIPWIRTAAWGVSLVGLILIFLQLI
tara:strand:+ start:302 stop:709 length:408 start_codon:yes stop_codon:yes gene_type:complete